MPRTTPVSTVFYYLTDPETARNIVDRGFAGTGIWSPQSAITLLDRMPEGRGGAVVRVSVTPELVPAVMKSERSDAGAEHRKFVVPVEYLHHAYLTFMTQDGVRQ